MALLDGSWRSGLRNPQSLWQQSCCDTVDGGHSGQRLLRGMRRTGGEDASARSGRQQSGQYQHDRFSRPERNFQSILTGVRARAERHSTGQRIRGAERAITQSTQGNLESTGNPLDVAIQGPGFFAVQTGDGVRYTRNGSFRVSANGQLLSASGDPVLGEQGPIQLANGSVTISGDGTISIDGALAGKLRVVEFPPSTPITNVGGVVLFGASGGGQAGERVQAGAGKAGVLQCESGCRSRRADFDPAKRGDVAAGAGHVSLSVQPACGARAAEGLGG